MSKETVISEEARKKEDITKYYKLGDELGRGTYAVVRQVTNKKTGVEMAVKIIKKKLFNRPEFLEREIAIMKQVQHPNIIEFYDIFEDKEKIYLVMQLVTGGDLFDKVTERETFTEIDASDITRQILEALSYLHKNGIVHRDIKVDNILCSEEGKKLHAYIADFGLSRFFSTEYQMQSKVGSLEYTAPEVFNNGAGYGPACDLWSVGVVVFILLTGTFPFSDKNPKNTYEKIINVDYDWDGSHDVSDEVKDFCHRLFKKDPAQRLSADEALQHPWIKGEGLLPVQRTPSLQKLIGLNKKRKEKKNAQ